MEAIRINKYLSAKGICSRRQADKMLEEGRILVDGVQAVPGIQVSDANEILIDGVLVQTHHTPSPVLLAVNKPVGIVCTTAKFDKDNIVDFLKYPTRVYPIGRLDKDSEGLILMTNQGELVNKILRGSNNHEKEYVVRVNKPITRDFLRAMREGVPILDTVTKPCYVKQTGTKTFHIILTQGLNRQIRRMCEYLGMRVVSLKRLRIMNVELGDLSTGNYREITGEEYNELMKLLENSSSLSYKQRMENNNE
ncbi:Ribosomal large subunit pseudouridine synthase F [Lachnospiraceae bacterium TWA4]|nr:Ribosomal large subunit pseudouridine synthase F [Lachnospiraceae bacterium TWA4]